MYITIIFTLYICIATILLIKQISKTNEIFEETLDLKNQIGFLTTENNDIKGKLTLTCLKLQQHKKRADNLKMLGPDGPDSSIGINVTNFSDNTGYEIAEKLGLPTLGKNSRITHLGDVQLLSEFNHFAKTKVRNGVINNGKSSARRKRLI